MLNNKALEVKVKQFDIKMYFIRYDKYGKINIKVLCLQIKKKHLLSIKKYVKKSKKSLSFDNNIMYER